MNLFSFVLIVNKYIMNINVSIIPIIPYSTPICRTSLNPYLVLSANILYLLSGFVLK